MDVTVISLFTILALVHIFCILVGFYVLFLPRINSLNKQIAYCGIVGVGFPLFITDIMIILMSADATTKDLTAFISLMDVYACLVFNLFIPQLFWGKVVQVFKGLAPKFYETCCTVLSVKVSLLILGSFLGLSLCCLSDKNYLPLFCLIENTYSIITCFLFVSVVYTKLKQMDLIFSASPSRRNSDTNNRTSAKVSDISVQSTVENKKKDGFEKATSEFRIMMYAAIVEKVIFVALVVNLGSLYFNPDDVRSGYMTSIPWKFQSGIAAMNIPLAMILSKF